MWKVYYLISCAYKLPFILKIKTNIPWMCMQLELTALFMIVILLLIVVLLRNSDAFI